MTSRTLIFHPHKDLHHKFGQIWNMKYLVLTRCFLLQFVDHCITARSRLYKHGNVKSLSKPYNLGSSWRFILCSGLWHHKNLLLCPARGSLLLFLHFVLKKVPFLTGLSCLHCILHIFILSSLIEVKVSICEQRNLHVDVMWGFNSEPSESWDLLWHH